MRLLQRVGDVLPGRRRPAPADVPAEAPDAPGFAPGSASAASVLPTSAPATPPGDPSRPLAADPEPQAAPRGGAAKLPEFPDLDLMALLPPELRQPAPPSGRPASREATSLAAPAGDPATSWEAEATSFAFRPPNALPEAQGRPEPATSPERPVETPAPACGLSGFLQDGLQRLASRTPAKTEPERLPSAAPASPSPAPSGFAAFLADGLRNLDAPQPAPPLRDPAPGNPPAARAAAPRPAADWSLPANPSLAGAREIAGFVAVCLVDSGEGLLLAAEGRGLDLDAAAALGTEVIRAERRAIELLGLGDDLEDMLVTTGRHLHVIRPLRALPTAFLYLILDRRAAILGMARLQLDRIESGLSP